VEGRPLTLPAAPIQIAYGNLTAVLLVQLPLMLLLPLVAGFVARRRLGQRLTLFWIGGATFVASQVVHLPLNFALGLLGPPRGLALAPLPVVAVAAGLSAGLCEELARYATFRWVLRRDRGYRPAVQVGLGHGGVEAMIFGLLALSSFANVLLEPWAGALGASEADRAILHYAAHRYWETPWYHAALAGWERVCAMAFHTGASVLVMRAVTRGRLGYLALAVGLHTALDAPVVYASQMGLFWLYVLLTAAALGMALVAWKLDDP